MYVIPYNKMSKIYKPSTYEHISYLKSKSVSCVDNILHEDKSSIFSNKIVPDKETNTINTSIIYSQGSDIFEINCSLPINDTSTEEVPKPENEYGHAFAFCEKENV